MRYALQVALGISAIAVIGLIENPDSYNDMSVRPEKEPVTLTAKEARLAEFYANQGSNEPVMMAVATAKAKRPRLMAAVAAVESGGNPHAIGRIGEVTAWQIRKEIWGDPGYTLDEHMQSAEEILEQLISESNGNLRKALSRYNGDRTGKYASAVMQKVAMVKL